MQVGFIGLGAMGRPMAGNLARKSGGGLLVCDTRSDVQAIASEMGAQVVKSPAELARRCRVIFTMLPDDAAVSTVLLGLDGVSDGAHADLTIVDFSTIGPWTLKHVAEDLAGKGAKLFGGAVTLGVKSAIEGTLAVYLDDGAAEDEAVSTLVRTFSKEIVPTRGLASSKVIKLINNLMVSVNVAATAEAIVLAEKAGLPAEALVPLIAKGSGASYALNNQMAKGALIDDAGPGKFGTDYILKDLDIILEMARRHDHPAFFGALSTAAYRGTKSLGYGAHYYPIVLEWMERAAGEQPRQRKVKKEQAA